jgi:hypothetical protein
MSQVGIEETKEVLIALDELSLVVLKQIKDGLQISDLATIVMTVLASDEIKAVLSRAVAGISQVPAEIKDVDFSEGMLLIKEELAYIPKFISVLKS